MQACSERRHSTLQLPVWELLGAINTRRRVVEVPKVDDEVAPQHSLGIRIESLDSLVHEVRVKETEVAEIGAGGVRGIGVHSVDVPPSCNGVRCQDVEDASPRGRCRGPPEVSWVLGVPEEECGVGHINTEVGTVGDTPVDEEGIWERRFAKSSKEARRGEVELGVGGDGLLDAAVAELAGNLEVVKPSSEPVAIIDELGNGGMVS